MQLSRLVTGTGRCGTVSLARLLTLVGIPCGHEMFFTYHGLEMAKKRLAGHAPLRLSHASTTKFSPRGSEPIDEWLTDLKAVKAESSYMAAPFLLDPLFDETEVLHIVRHPIPVITSFCQYLKYFGPVESLYEQFIYTHVPEVKEQSSQIARAAKYYILWNEMIERNAQGHKYERCRIEDEVVFGINNVIPKDTNSFERPGVAKFTWENIPVEIRPDLEAIAVRYGYKIC